VTSAPRPDEPRPDEIQRALEIGPPDFLLGEEDEPRAATVAALYVETGGTYFGLPGVDPWDEARDARLYDGPFPVVAHPPCNRWSRLSAGRLRGQDGGCFASALVSVRTYGGALEHPAHSQAWPAFGLSRPHGPGWERVLGETGWVCEVDQSLWGYPARKPTWLYFVGERPPKMPAHYPRHSRSCADVWSRKRSRTPEAFRDVLLAMARSVYAARAAA